MMNPPSPARRGLRLSFSLLLVVLLAYAPSRAASDAKPLVALLLIAPSNPKSANSWLPQAVLHGLYSNFRQISSIRLLQPQAVAEALKSEKPKPGQQVDGSQVIAIGQKLKADLLVTTTYKLLEDDNVALQVRLIEPQTGSVKDTLSSSSPVDQLFDSLASVTLKTAASMNYATTGEERKRIKHHPTSSFQAYSDYQRALSAYDTEAGTGNLSEAVVLLTNAVKQDPHFAEARFQLGLLAARQGRSDQAAAQFQRLVEEHASYPNILHNLGLAKLNQGDYAAARREFLKSYQVDPRQANLLNDLALANYYLKDYESARKQLMAASELAPTSSVIWNNVGTVTYAQGNFSEAQKAYANAVQYNPKSVSSHYNLGLASLQLADIDQAKKAFEKTLELDPRHAKSYYSLALIAESDGTGKAAAYWKKYLDLAKADPAEQPYIEFAQRMLNDKGPPP